MLGYSCERIEQGALRLAIAPIGEQDLSAGPPPPCRVQWRPN